MKYAILLRGINVGGNTIKMQPLREALKRRGFQNVQTVLASGNVILESDLSKEKLENKVSEIIDNEFGFKISVIAISKGNLEKIANSEYFKQYKLGKSIKPYISFTQDSIPKELNDDTNLETSGFEIVFLGKNFICSIVDHENAGSPDLMKYLDKINNNQVTTRTLGTVEKILKKLQ